MSVEHVMRQACLDLSAVEGCEWFRKKHLLEAYRMRVRQMHAAATLGLRYDFFRTPRELA